MKYVIFYIYDFIPVKIFFCRFLNFLITLILYNHFNEMIYTTFPTQTNPLNSKMELELYVNYIKCIPFNYKLY